MSPHDHRHGTYAGVIAHGRARVPICDPCDHARRRMNKAAALDRHRGQPRLTPLGDDAWAIIHAWPRDQLAKLTGIRSEKFAAYEKNGPHATVNRKTRDKILAATGRNYWTPVGVQRRLMALQRLGYSMRAISNESGVDVDVLKRLWKRDAKFIRDYIAEAIVTTYDRLSMKPLPDGRSASRARNEAETRGWAPPLAWDNIDTDPEPQGVYTKPSSAQEWVAEQTAKRFAHLHHAIEHGYDLTRTLQELGVERDSLLRWCRRNDAGALWDTLKQRQDGRDGKETDAA